jgi:hypothetical protein
LGIRYWYWKILSISIRNKNLSGLLDVKGLSNSGKTGQVSFPRIQPLLAATETVSLPMPHRNGKMKVFGRGV